MRSALLLLALLLLCGCSLSASELMPKTHGSPDSRTVHVSLVAIPSAAAIPSRAPDALDLSSVARSAVSIPRGIADLEHAVVIATVSLGAIGLINAALLIRLATMRPRERLRVAPEQALEVVPAKTCACGAAISARTKSGRCRRCALEHRQSNSSNGRRETNRNVLARTPKRVCMPHGHYGLAECGSVPRRNKRTRRVERRGPAVPQR